MIILSSWYAAIWVLEPGKLRVYGIDGGFIWIKCLVTCPVATSHPMWAFPAQGRRGSDQIGGRYGDCGF